MPSRYRSLSFWLVPNLSLAATLAAAFYLLFLFRAPVSLFLDADPGWHIRAGEWILDHRRMPIPEPFSWVKLDTIWYAWEWLVEVLMALVFRAGGLPAIAFLYCSLLLLITWCWFKLQSWLGGSFLLTCVFAAMLVSLTQVHWLARPHVFGFVYLLAALAYLERQPRFDWRQGLVAFTFGVVWANSHPSFFLPVLMAGCYALGGRWKERLAVAAAYSAGTLVNPYFVSLHLHLLDFLTNKQYREYIQEWNAYSLDGSQPLLILPALLVCAAGAVLAWRQKRRDHAAVIALFLLMAMTSTRNLALTGLIALPLANVAITRAVRSRTWNKLSSELADVDREFGGYALVPVAAVLMWMFLHRPDVAAVTGFAPDRFPVRAAEALRSADPSARVFADIIDGGYLIWHFEGKRPVFVDGRGDYMALGPYRRAWEILQGKPGWREQMSQLDFRYALLRNNTGLLSQLQKEGWETIHQDEHYSVVRK